jgi:ectoine hydroxylase
MTTMNLDHDVSEFWARGYVIVPGAFRKDEMDILKKVITGNASMSEHAARAKEKGSLGTRPSFDTIFVWNDTSRFDVFSKVTRSYKLIDRLEAFFGDAVYVYHNKVALKYPGIVGFSYHQDYAYWYDMGNLFPDMATAFVAIDRATTENGCLKIIEGSHKLGRLNHVYRDGVSDSGVDPERLAVIERKLPEVSIELESGDAVIFHCNVLHGSDDNRSDDSRMALLGCYNTRHNDPYKSVHGLPAYHPQSKICDEIVPEDATKLPDFFMRWAAPVD